MCLTFLSTRKSVFVVLMNGGGWMTFAACFRCVMLFSNDGIVKKSCLLKGAQSNRKVIVK